MGVEVPNSRVVLVIMMKTKLIGLRCVRYVLLDPRDAREQLV
jgi:hypothetical protein